LLDPNRPRPQFSIDESEISPDDNHSPQDISRSLATTGDHLTYVNPTMTPNIFESVRNRVRAPNSRYQSIATAAKVPSEEFPTISQALKSIDRSQ